MKKTMLAILMLITTCAATNLYAEDTEKNQIVIMNNKFYSSKPYLYTEWHRTYDYDIYCRFIHITEDNKTYLRIMRRMYDEIQINNNDYIIIIFNDGQEYRLDYCTELFYKQFSKDTNYQNYWKIEAMGEIDNFTGIDKIVYIENGYADGGSISMSYYYNYDLVKIYNDLITTAKKIKEEKNE